MTDQKAQVVQLDERREISENGVSKSNALVDASTRLSLDEQRLIFCAISKIDSRPSTRSPSTTITITGQEFADAWGLNPTNAYRQLYQAADNLFEQVIIFQHEDRREKIRWLQKQVERTKGHGEVILKFSEDVSPYLTQLSGDFSTFKLGCIRHLTSQHAQRLYELLNRFLDTGCRSWSSIEQFRFSMGLEGRYPEFKDLRRYVIAPATKDINATTNIKAECRPIKRGRRVAGIEFTMSEQRQPDLFGQAKGLQST